MRPYKNRWILNANACCWFKCVDTCHMSVWWIAKTMQSTSLLMCAKTFPILHKGNYMLITFIMATWNMYFFLLQVSPRQSCHLQYYMLYILTIIGLIDVLFSKVDLFTDLHVCKRTCKLTYNVRKIQRHV